MQSISSFYFFRDVSVRVNESEKKELQVLSGDYECVITGKMLSEIFHETLQKEQLFVAQVRSNNFDRWYEGFAICQWLAHSFADPYSRRVPEFIRLYRYERTVTGTLLDQDEMCPPQLIAGFREMSTCSNREELFVTYDDMMTSAPVDKQIMYIHNCLTHRPYEAGVEKIFSTLCGDLDRLCAGIDIADPLQRQNLILFARSASERGRPDVAQQLLPILRANVGVESIEELIYLGNSLWKLPVLPFRAGQQALEVFEIVLTLDPQNVIALSRCAVILADGSGGVQRDVQRAIDYLQRALDSGHTLALCRLSSLLCRYFVDGHQRALQYALDVLEENPCDETALCVAIKLCRHGCFNASSVNHHYIEPNIALVVRCITQALASKPAHELALKSLIELCDSGEIGEFYDVALAHLLRAYQIVPEDMVLLHAIAELYKSGNTSGEGSVEKNYLLAERFAQEMLKIHSTNRDACFLLAQMCAEGGYGIDADPERAIAYLDDILQINSQDLEAIYLFVSLSCEPGSVCEKYLPKAVLYLRSIAIDPASPANLILGTIYSQGGYGVEKNPNEAVRYLRNVALHGRMMRTAIGQLRTVYFGADARGEGSLLKYCEVASSFIISRIISDVISTAHSVFYRFSWPAGAHASDVEQELHGEQDE